MVDPHESSWCLDAEDGSGGKEVKVLSITLVKPPLTEDEIMWKKGNVLPRPHPSNAHREEGCHACLAAVLYVV